MNSINKTIKEENNNKPILINWDAHYHLDKNKTLISNVKHVKVSRKQISENEDSLFSREMGSLIDTEEETREYCCDCKNLRGRFYEGQLCPQCNTVVKDQFRSDIMKMGWIDIAPYKLITPAAYFLISEVIGEKSLEKILENNTPLDIDGMPIKKEIIKSRPYDNIGIIEFEKKFEQILLFYANKSKNPKKIRNAKLLIRMKRRCFCTKIPVMNSLLRPAFLSNKKTSLKLDPINKPYISLIRNADIVRRNVSKIGRISILNTLWSMQKSLCELGSLIITTKFSDKKKVIKGKIMGSKMGFSSRAVICPLLEDENFGLNNIVISYKAFLELFTLEIINMLVHDFGGTKFSKMTPYEIINYINLAKYSYEVDEDLLRLMYILIEKHQDGLWNIINRNPTLDMGSTQALKIVDVIPDAQSVVMLVPLNILPPMNGDFDGDILNQFNLKEKSIVEAFVNGFAPEVLLVDRTGSSIYNSNYSIYKDIATGLCAFTIPQEELEIY